MASDDGIILQYIDRTIKTTVPNGGWSGGAMALGKLPLPVGPTILITVGQGPIALAVGAGGGGLDIFTLIYSFSSFFSLGWLVDWLFWISRPFETVFQSISSRRPKRRERIDESKKCPNNPHPHLLQAQ